MPPRSRASIKSVRQQTLDRNKTTKLLLWVCKTRLLCFWIIVGLDKKSNKKTNKQTKQKNVKIQI